MSNSIGLFVLIFSEWCVSFVLLTGMYHVFLLIKDGFFHITNLALAKIETGIKTSRAADLKFSLRHCVDQIKHQFFFVNTAIEKMDVGALKEVS